MPSLAPTLDTADHALDAVLAEISEKLRAGEDVSVESYCREHSAIADQLRAVLPAMRVLADLDVGPRAHDTTSGRPAGNDAADHFSHQPTANHQQPQTLGDFRILHEIGRGGMGIVYEAEQLSLRRRVALKILPFAGMLDPRTLARFENEARAAATLHHENIVPVYFVGHDRGVHYYAMQLIRGASLAEVIAALRGSVVSGPLSVAKIPPAIDNGQRHTNQPATDHGQLTTDESQIETEPLAALSTEYTENPKRYFGRVAEIGIRIAQALDHAHQLGILHRDVKPANILLDAAGKPWITDFGLARIGTDPSMTITGDIVGTLRYMSPEQLNGQAAVVDHRTDVYSLGVTLYELATGTPAFAGQDRADLVRRISEQDPRPPRSLRPEIPPDLETIIHKAIEKDPQDRYASAADLATDLQRHLSHEPIQARRPSLASRARKWSRRHPALLASAFLALAVSLVAALAAAGVARSEKEKTAIALHEAQQNLHLADQERERARRSLKKAIETVDRMYVSFVQNWLASDAYLSTVQFNYLKDALAFYEELTTTLGADPVERNLLAVAHERIAAIEHHLHHYDRAARAWQQAIAVCKQLPTKGPHSFAAREYLVRQYAGLGASLERLGRLDDADEAYREGLDHVQRMAEEFPNQPKYRLEVSRYRLRRAALLSQLDRPEEAEAVAIAAREAISRALSKELPGADPYLLSLDAGRIFARIHWQQGRLDEARDSIEKTLGVCRKLRVEDFSDLRPLVLLEVDLRVLSGDLALAAGEPERAVQAYRDALDLKRQTFRAQLAPALFEQKTFMNKDAEWDGQWEPGPFTEYNEIAQRLAVALSQAGRPYEAETLLGECVTSAGIIDDSEQGVLQYGIAQANSVALAAQLLESTRPDDADKLRAQAVDEWCRILGEFPHAAEYTSGFHGLQEDLAWFRETFPGERLTPRPPNKDEEHDYGKNAGEDTIFIEHSAGRLGYRSGAYAWAIKRFHKAAAMRESGHEFDWLYLAMAHAKLGQHDRAQEWLRKANESIDASATPDPELVELRDQATTVVQHE